MLSKTRLFLWITAGLLLAGLAGASAAAERLGSGEIMLAAPVSSNSSRVDAAKLEEMNGDSFLLTYEILSQMNIRALNSNYDVTLVQTNYTYRNIMGYRMRSGSFFSEEDQDSRKKEAVLNEAAASAMFGDFDVCGRHILLDGEGYVVAGVMTDRYDAEAEKSGEEAPYHVYVPASVSGEDPVSFAVQLNDGLTEAMAKNKIKEVTIPESAYNVISLAAMADLADGLLLCAVKLSFIGVLLLLSRKCLRVLRKDVLMLKKLNGQLYFREMLRIRPGSIIRTAAVFAAMMLSLVLILNIILSFAGYLLLWHDSIPLLQSVDVTAFGNIASGIVRVICISALLLAGFFVDLIFILKHNTSRRSI